jgi:hypothetical protein
MEFIRRHTGPGKVWLCCGQWLQWKNSKHKYTAHIPYYIVKYSTIDVYALGGGQLVAGLGTVHKQGKK